MMTALRSQGGVEHQRHRHHVDLIRKKPSPPRRPRGRAKDLARAAQCADLQPRARPHCRRPAARAPELDDVEAAKVRMKVAAASAQQRRRTAEQLPRRDQEGRGGQPQQLHHVRPRRQGAAPWRRSCSTRPGGTPSHPHRRQHHQPRLFTGSIVAPLLTQTLHHLRPGPDPRPARRLQDRRASSMAVEQAPMNPARPRCRRRPHDGRSSTPVEPFQRSSLATSDEFERRRPSRSSCREYLVYAIAFEVAEEVLARGRIAAAPAPKLWSIYSYRDQRYRQAARLGGVSRIDDSLSRPFSAPSSGFQKMTTILQEAGAAEGRRRIAAVPRRGGTPTAVSRTGRSAQRARPPRPGGSGRRHLHRLLCRPTRIGAWP